MGTICSSCTDPVSPSDSTDFDEDPELNLLLLLPADPGDFLGLRLFFLVFSSNNEGPVENQNQKLFFYKNILHMYLTIVKIYISIYLKFIFLPN